ncbi:MAG: pyridoxal phosphate-dependent aminotransferase [Bacteroidales bacterium]|nr:pyridoxal phosphate-dependent aminotransferase [Bacteroidales bacterium]MDD2204499.1 pyridoxal phosphate-dependent aminotransferase [Bacteroidales bacterium]MDD3914613.1 pyridoxal phosphate-dependent aminotransferase [Bacteroidales bacterium]MDD4633818.1 pyridoxal phosphate-dependent aminotransferase [Bacteroidales bacterium]
MTDFNQIFERKGTNCVKHDMLTKVFGTEDVIPMWVADMDFQTPDCIMEAIAERCKHKTLGYTFASESYYNTMICWLKKHYDIEAQSPEIHFIPGIVAGIAFCINALTKLNDKILINTPVYPPFINLPIKNGRTLVTNKLKIVNGILTMDFEDLEAKAKGCKLMILSNPHNPGGTVWSKEDLKKIADICERNKVIVISDEIHADLTLPGYEHHSFASVSTSAQNISITFIAPSKTFNIAGLGSSICYIHNKEIRETFWNFLNNNEIANGNIFAYIGAEAAFKYGEEWLCQLKNYLLSNVNFLRDFITTKMDCIKVVYPQASYLAWLDFRALNMEHKDLVAFLINKAKVGLNSGVEFGGRDYEGFMRMNIGCPQQTLEKALNNIYKAINKL